MKATDEFGDKLVRQIGALMDELRGHEFPRLVVEDVTDDGETFKALRCPRCGHLVEAGELYAVCFAERWASSIEQGEEDMIHETMMFSAWSDDDPEWGKTVYYRHDTHAVSLPESWKEGWSM